jgi:hypothetical protein
VDVLGAAAEAEVDGGADEVEAPDEPSHAARPVTMLTATTMTDIAVRKALWRRLSGIRAEVAKESP